MSHMNQMNHVNKHMGVGPCMSPAAPMMGSISPCHIVGSPMACGPPVGSPINCGPPMGNCSPMGGGGNNPNCGPVGSPHTSCNSRQISRSPLVCTPMSTSSVMSNSPMNVNSVHPMNRSPSSLGSPLSSVMASNVRGNSPLDCGLGINSVGSQKGSPMSVMGSHNMNSLNCGSPMGSPSNVPMSQCNSSMMGSPITSPLSVPCSMSGGSDMNMNMNGVMNRSPMNAPPNSVNSSMMCNSSMRGPSPIGGGPMNGPMSMNCNQNMNIGPKSDMNMNELVLRDNCGPPGHMPMKPNNGLGPCGMPVSSASCTRQPDIVGMQCGPMNSMHCNSMMSNQCGPGMNNVNCIGGGGMNRPQCGPGGMGGPMGMGNPYDGMNPQQQCRPNMNRSQFPRGMANVHYGGPNSMNAPPMNGPNMSMCGPPDMGNMQCGPNGNVNSMHCSDSPMNNQQCMGPNMNQCSGPMFNSQFSPFDVNASRCSPNLPFGGHDMGGMNNQNFYRSNMSNAPPCMPNMNPAVCTGANDPLSGVGGNSIMSAGNTMKNDSSTVDSDIASVVCGMANDGADDLNLIGDNLLRDSKTSEDRKLVKDMLDESGGGGGGADSKEDELGDNKPSKAELDCKMNEEKEAKADGDAGKTEPVSTPSPTAPTTTATTTSTTSTCTTTITGTPNSAITSTTTTSVTATETNATSDDAEHLTNASSKNENAEDDEYTFKSSSNEPSNAAGESESTNEDAAGESKVKAEPEDKLLEGEFHDDEEKAREEKAGNEEGNAKSADDNTSDGEQRKENNANGGAPVKMENEDFYDGNMKGKPEPGNGMRGNGNNGFSNGGMMPNPPVNFSVPTSNDVVMNSGPCMNDSMCGSPMLPNMNRLQMPPNALNHSMNHPNRSMNMYPDRVSRICVRH